MVPRFTEFYIPVLQVMSDVEPIEINALIDKVADHVQLSELDRSVITEGGTQLKYRSNISWAVTDLSQGNFIERVKRGHYVITIKGLELLEEKPVNIGREYLAKCSDEFRTFLERRGTRKKNVEEIEGKKLGQLSKTSSPKEDKKASSNPQQTILEELYKAVETLKKANISTSELERKIFEIEGDMVVGELLEPLSKLLSTALDKLSQEHSVVTINFQRGKYLELVMGNHKKTYSLIEDTKKVSVNKNLNNKHSEKLAKQLERTVTDSFKKSSSKQVCESERPQIKKKIENSSASVWMQYYTDKTIIVDGSTESFIDLFQSYGGVKLRNSNSSTAWMFMRNREEGLRNDLKDYLIEKPKDLEGANSPSQYKVEAEEVYTEDASVNTIRVSEEIVDQHLDQLSKLKSFNFMGITGPHKAILLITIFEGIRLGQYKENKITFTEELEKSYNRNWSKYVGGFPSLGAVYPYIHLGREKFFNHILIKGIRNYDKMWNRRLVDQHVKYAVLPNKLYNVIKDDVSYTKIKDQLIRIYCEPQKKDVTPISQSSMEREENVEVSATPVDNSAFITNPIDIFNAFRNFLTAGSGKNGKSYTKSTISVYIGAMNSSYLNNLIKDNYQIDNIFEITDTKTIEAIKEKVEIDCAKNTGSRIYRSALSLYLKFIKEVFLLG